jgi:hypothetical protein
MSAANAAAQQAAIAQVAANKIVKHRMVLLQKTP